MNIWLSIFFISLVDTIKSLVKCSANSVSFRMFTFQHPFTCVVSGPTQSGKTEFILKVISEKIIDPLPTKIVWCYGELNERVSNFPNISKQKGLFEDDLDSQENNLIIIDDLMIEASKKSELDSNKC